MARPVPASTLVMRPSLTTMSTSLRGGAPVPSNSVPQRTARTATSGSVDDDTVVAPSRLGRDVAFADVAADGLGIALGRWAPTTAAAGHDPDDFTGGDRMLRGLAHVTSRAVRGTDLHAIHGAIASPAESPGRRRLPLEAEGDEGRREELVHALDAEPAAKLPGAARVRPKAVAENTHRGHARFDDLDRIVARGRAREDDHRRLAVICGARARPARVEIALDEQAAGLRMSAERDGRHLVAIGAGGNPARQRIGERAQPQLDEQVDRHVIASRRRGLLGGEHRAPRHDDAQRAETSLVDR